MKWEGRRTNPEWKISVMEINGTERKTPKIWKLFVAVRISPRVSVLYIWNAREEEYIYIKDIRGKKLLSAWRRFQVNEEKRWNKLSKRRLRKWNVKTINFQFPRKLSWELLFRANVRSCFFDPLPYITASLETSIIRFESSRFVNNLVNKDPPSTVNVNFLKRFNARFERFA